jgi:hypothetical protein
MSNDKKYSPKTIFTLLKIMLSVRNDLSKEEKRAVYNLAEQIIYKNRKQDYENKQTFPIQDYKRRN